MVANGKWQNPLGMEVLVGKSLINGPFSIVMFDYRRVNQPTNRSYVSLAMKLFHVIPIRWLSEQIGKYKVVPP